MRVSHLRESIGPVPSFTNEVTGESCWWPVVAESTLASLIKYLLSALLLFERASCPMKAGGHTRPCTLSQPVKAAGCVPAPVSRAVLLKPTGTCSPHKADSLIAWLWCLEGFCSWVPCDCNNQGNSSWQATTPRALCRQQTEIHPQSFGEQAYLLVLELQPEVHTLEFATHLEVTEVLAGNVGQGTPSLCSPLALLQPTSTS